MSNKHKDHDRGHKHDHDHDCEHHEIMSGELFVIGKEEIFIRLKHTEPKTVLVEFKGHQHHIPCNPHHDKLEWEIMHKGDYYVLVIKWDVQGIREVVWAVSY